MVTISEADDMMTIDVKGLELKKANVEIKAALAKEGTATVENADECYGLGSGLSAGILRFEGDVGDYTGMVNNGAELLIGGSARNFLGDNMISGKISVAGDSGYGAGMYCYGGTIHVKGNAGDFTGTMNKGATIIIGGDVGHDVGTYMVKGDIIIGGNAGENLGNYIIRGAIFLGGEAESLGNNMNEVPLDEQETARLKKLLASGDFGINPSKLKKFVPLTDKPFYKAKVEEKNDINEED